MERNYSYSDTISYLAEKKEDKYFKNAGEYNKNLVLLNIIKNSNREIKICENESNVRNYDEKIILELSKFIWEKNGDLKILLNNFSGQSAFHKFTKDKYYLGKVNIKITDKKFLNKETGQEGYFILGDNSKLALFFDDRERQKTIANFNDNKYFNNFNKFFEETFNCSEHSRPFFGLETIA